MKRLGKIFGVAVVAAFTLCTMALPATAVTPPGTAVCTGTASVSPGIFAPGFGDRQDFDWSLDTTCTTISGDLVETDVRLIASGTAEGWCGQSFGLTGSGNLGGVSLSGITWVSAGSILQVSGSHGGGGAQTFTATVQANGGLPCTTPGGATSFDVVIVSVFA